MASGINVITYLDAIDSKNPARSLTITVPTHVHSVSEPFNVIPYVKRCVAEQTKISPVLQRCTLTTPDSGNTVPSQDVFTLPATVNVSWRTNSSKQPRVPALNIKVKPLEEDSCVPVYNVKVAQDDTILDIKFLLAEIIGNSIQAENITLYQQKPKQPCRLPLYDSTTVQQIGITDGTMLRIMFIIPSNQKGHGHVHRSSWKLVEYGDSQIQNLGTNFRVAAKKFKNRKFLGTRRWSSDLKSRTTYEWLSYGQVDKRVTNLGSGLRSMGLEKGDRIGIMAINRQEWIIADYACSTQSFISVPLYDTLGHDAVEYIINHANVKAIVAEKKALKAIAAAKDRCPSLKYVILMDDQIVDKAFVKEHQNDSSPLYTHTMSQAEREGSQHVVEDVLPKYDDLLTICYTSGTTGNPKGVMLTHGAIVSTAAAISRRSPPFMHAGDQVLFSYLPLAHIYERVIEASFLKEGNSLGFSQGDNTKLVEDVQELKPTIFPGVPRVWQRIYDRVNQQVAEGGKLKAVLYNRAYATKLKQLYEGEEYPGSSVWDKIVFKKVAERFGGNLRQVVSGAAPLSPKIAEYIRINFQVNFTEGYGLTETSGASCVTHWYDNVYGIVGIPQSCIEVKLVDVPDMEYSVHDQPNPRGEIWFRGPPVFKGYYQQPDTTKECLTDDGWFATGDIGTWLPDGNLKVIDRKKNLFKLAQGEYLRPEYIEGIYKQCTYLANVYVHGDSNENHLVAVVVPEPEKLQALASQLGVKGDTKKLCSDEKVKAAIYKAMTDVAKREKLKGFEMVKNIHLSAEDFSVDNGLLTPTLKLKRNIAAKHYAQQIKEMYKRGEIKEGASSQQIKSKL